MNDRQMRYILAVAETRNISAAARQLFISQPSLSAMIRNAEDQLGTQLFDRSTSPLSLTQAGEYYVDAARRILSIERDMKRKIQETSEQVSGPLSVGCSSATSSLIMSFFVPKFIKLYPDVRLSIVEDHASRLGELLQRGEADILVTPSVLEGDTFTRRILAREEVILLAPLSFRPDAPKIIEGRAFPAFDFAVLDDQPFALMKEGHLTRALQDSVIIQEGFRPKTVLETDRWETCVSMVENGLAFTILPFSRFKKDLLQEKVRAFSFNIPVYREISIYYRTNSMIPNAAKAFIEFSETEFAKMAAEEETSG